MAINLNDNVFSASPKLLDAKWGPFPDLTTAYSSVLPSFRKIGMFAIISPPAGPAQLYWYKNDTDNLVLFSGNSSVEIYPAFVNFPTIGSPDVIYIDKTESKSYYWNAAGSNYQLTTSTVEVYDNSTLFPAEGVENVIYIADDTNISYLWNPALLSGNGDYEIISGTPKKDRVTYHDCNSGTADTYTVTTATVTTNTIGDAYLIKFDIANTGPSTLQMGTAPAVDLYNTKTGLDVASGDIEAGVTHLVVYTSANVFEILTIGGGSSTPQNLQDTLIEGNEADGVNIKLLNDTAIELDNGSLLRKGTYNFGNIGDVIVTGITDAGTGLIANISGWGDIGGTKWSDLNGTYIKTSVAVTPTGYITPNIGMHTPVAGTYNYYLQLLGNPGLNGIAYFLAPGNRSGWGADPDDDTNTDPPATYWRLCVLSDWPYTYFTNPSTDAYNFPTTGWVPVDNTIPDSEGGNGYDYIATYDTGFTATLSNILNGNGGISRICSIGYEDMWQAGIRYVFGNSGTIREATNCFNYIPDNTFDVNKRFAVGSRWVLDNGDTYICTDNTSNAATWNLLTRSTGFEQNFLLMGG